jgi:ATP-dependent protease HslVU (ClpYQ) peptidase subunit
MTTIAVRNDVVAFDSRITSSDGICVDRVDKAWVSQKHQAIIAVCGSLAKGSSVARFIESKTKLPWDDKNFDPAKMPELDDATQIMFFMKDGRAFIIEQNGWIETKAPFWAMGSGSQAALVAMECGADAEIAVELAIQFDHLSGPPVNVLSLADIPERKRVKRRK